ncbi:MULTISPECIES: DUF3040 domain-containing protein [Nocardiopsis]|uniref:Uncharacterized protein n=1 Tax=Nocardiopsis sinuspersici TaxID=501010 RepID=A0A1V3BZ77_9ACTN|nr:MULTISPECIES: DUF3040 domain-containing protein [Nocardiopsis]OOC53748.1 hypothetical protein NOSIN_08000 [Nocardiopsis sinuspersici]
MSIPHDDDDDVHLRAIEAHLAAEDPDSARRLECYAARVGGPHPCAGSPPNVALLLVWTGMIVIALLFLLASR